MTTINPEFLQQLAQCCCPGISLLPAEDAALPLLTSGVFKTHRPRILFTPKFTLWNTRFREYLYIFHVAELNFDTLAQCHTCAIEAGSAHFNPIAKHNRTQVTAVIICDSVQADAMEALTSFKHSAGSPFSTKARLVYRLAALDCSGEDVSCNRRARKLHAALQALLSDTVVTERRCHAE